MQEEKNKPCSKCGGEFPYYCMDFHHRDPSTKKFGVGRGGLRNSIKLIKEEIDKCDLLCANCHRTVHHEEKLRDDFDR